MDSSLSEVDRSVVLEALEDSRREPRPPDRAPLGCAIALPGFAILLVFPVVARLFSVGSGVATVAQVVGITILVVGLGLWFSSGGKARRHAVAAADAALARLEGEGGDREAALRAATVLLTHAFAARGPTRFATFDVGDARRRLGGRLPLVTSVERFLLREEEVYPVFTEGASDDGGD